MHCVKAALPHLIKAGGELLVVRSPKHSGVHAAARAATAAARAFCRVAVVCVCVCVWLSVG